VVCTRHDVEWPTDGWETLPLAASEARPESVTQTINRLRDVEWRIRRLPTLPARGSRTLDDIVIDPGDDSPNWWSRERAEYLLNQMSSRHRRVADDMIARRKWSYGTVFRRVRHGRSMAELRTDGFAGCLRTPKGGSGRQILFQAGYGKFKVRLLSPDECARLMGAEGFRVKAPLNQALFGFGDGVCADVIQWIAEHYLSPLLDGCSESPTRAGVCAK
jgi:DNA (cytosine-5)-methyltransferase 1